MSYGIEYDGIEWHSWRDLWTWKVLQKIWPDRVNYVMRNEFEVQGEKNCLRITSIGGIRRKRPPQTKDYVIIKDYLPNARDLLKQACFDKTKGYAHMSDIVKSSLKKNDRNVYTVKSPSEKNDQYFFRGYSHCEEEIGIIYTPFHRRNNEGHYVLETCRLAFCSKCNSMSVIGFETGWSCRLCDTYIGDAYGCYPDNDKNPEFLFNPLQLTAHLADVKDSIRSDLSIDEMIKFFKEDLDTDGITRFLKQDLSAASYLYYKHEMAGDPLPGMSEQDMHKHFEQVLDIKFPEVEQINLHNSNAYAGKIDVPGNALGLPPLDRFGLQINNHGQTVASYWYNRYYRVYFANIKDCCYLLGPWDDPSDFRSWINKPGFSDTGKSIGHPCIRFTPIDNGYNVSFFKATINYYKDYHDNFDYFERDRGHIHSEESPYADNYTEISSLSELEYEECYIEMQSIEAFLDLCNINACVNVAFMKPSEVQRAEGRTVEEAPDRVEYREAYIKDKGRYISMSSIISQGSKGLMPLHTCRGHIKHYTEDKPLFGRIVGNVWCPPHMKGNPKNGKIIKTYSVGGNNDRTNP